jgi:AraC-like DNA-binding protein
MDSPQVCYWARDYPAAESAAERAGRGDVAGWAAVAANLGYADQAHLTREFTALIGVPPTRCG